MTSLYLATLALIAWLAALAVFGGRHAIPSLLRRVPGPMTAGKRATWIANVAGAVALAGVWAWLTVNRPTVVDATVYWTIDLDSLYRESRVNEVGAFLYSPAFAQVAAPFTNLPWSVWYAGWAAINLGLLAWMLGPPAAALTLLFPAVSHALWSGNIHFLTAASAVVAVRWSAAWAFPLLTKVTPGVAVLWHLGAREWRRLAAAIAWTTGIVAASFLVAPQLWRDWIAVLSASSAVEPPPTLLPLPLMVRVGLAALIVFVGGVRGWAWTIPVAMVVAQPLFWTAGLAALVAVVPLANDALADPGPPARTGFG